ncbi:MAG: chloride channel protein [Halofilum sp. (in: g-proteobacteria)]
MASWLNSKLAGGISVGRRALAVSTRGLIMGGVASLAALGFVAAIQWLNDLFWVSPRSRMMATDWPWLPLATIAVLVCGGLIVGLIARYLLPGGQAHGPPEVIETAQDGSNDVDLRTGAGSALSALTSLGAGASVGQYGPLVHLGATMGSLVGRIMPSGQGNAAGLIGIGCGVAAAIATAFSAPIAGVLFAHEVVLRQYSLRAFAPITVAATIGFVLASYVFEHEPLFRIPGAPRVEPAEYGAFILIGIGGAVVATGFMRAILAADELAERTPIPPVLRPATAGALLGILAIWIPDILGIGQQVLRFTIIPEAFGTIELAVLLVAKILATALCLGFGFVGGVFSPALLIGALFGALTGHAAVVLVPGAADSASVYAICGLAAVTSPVIGGPITTILIVFELTRNYVLTTAVMVSVVFANLVSYRIFGRSMFDEVLRRRGCDLSLGRDELMLSHRSIGPHISHEYVHVHPGETIAEARHRIAAADETEGHVIDAEGYYHGTVTLAGLTRAQDDTAAADDDVMSLARHADAILDSNANIWSALAEAEQGTARELPVLDEEGRMIGVIERQQLVGVYRRALFGIRREEHAAP